jgi:two-component system phosphate regulon response regulator PhoB
MQNMDEIKTKLPKSFLVTWNHKEIMSHEPRVFIVDDERDLTDLLCYQLKREGFRAESENDPFLALSKARDFGPDLIILDVMMPDLDGYQLLRMVRSDNLLSSVPVIMLTAKAGVEDRIKGLEQGADDYLGKPFDTKELFLRIRSILKRASEQRQPRSSRIVSGNVVLDEADHSIFICGERSDFTVTEFKLLNYFLKRKGRVQTRDNLLLGVWKFDAEVETRTVDVHIRRVRQKIEKSDLRIETIRGVGYRLIEKSE